MLLELRPAVTIVARLTFIYLRWKNDHHAALYFDTL